MHGSALPGFAQHCPSHHGSHAIIATGCRPFGMGRPSWRPFSIIIKRRSRCSTNCQASTVSIPQRLNNVPHQRETRQFFYQDACAAVKKAVEGKQQLLSVRSAGFWEQEMPACSRSNISRTMLRHLLMQDHNSRDKSRNGRVPHWVWLLKYILFDGTGLCSAVAP